MRSERSLPGLTLERLFCYNLDNMSIWQCLLDWLGLGQLSVARTYELDEDFYATLEDLAQREHLPPDELAAGLLASALEQRASQESLWQRWRSLSPREQDVAALACLGHTNRQIGARLGISAETVKTHLRNALIKFGLHTRSELGLLLEEWDFSAWDA